MIYRGSGFLAVVLFGSSPTLFPSLSRILYRLDRRHTGKLRKINNLIKGEKGEGGGGGAKSYDSKKAWWFFISHSILSVVTHTLTFFKSSQKHASF
jgi:hypothetical protein